MELLQLFTSLPSKAVRDKIISETGSSQEQFDELISFMLTAKEPYAWRAAWLADNWDEKFPGLGQKHLHRIIGILSDKRSDGFIRSCLRMISRYQPEERDQGILADHCFDWMVKESVPVAIKVYAMEILASLAKTYPELNGELVMVIEDQMKNNSAGFRARGTRILKQMKKEY